MFQNVDRENQGMLGKYGPGETQQSNLYVQIIDDAAHFLSCLKQFSSFTSWYVNIC